MAHNSFTIPVKCDELEKETITEQSVINVSSEEETFGEQQPGEPARKTSKIESESSKPTRWIFEKIPIQETKANKPMTQAGRVTFDKNIDTMQSIYSKWHANNLTFPTTPAEKEIIDEFKKAFKICEELIIEEQLDIKYGEVVTKEEIETFEDKANLTPTRMMALWNKRMDRLASYHSPKCDERKTLDDFRKKRQQMEFQGKSIAEVRALIHKPDSARQEWIHKRRMAKKQLDQQELLDEPNNEEDEQQQEDDNATM
jgi:hypothetical protein